MVAALDAIRALNTTVGPRCGTGIFLEQNPALADTVTEAMADDSIQSKAIAKWLKATHGIELGYSSIQRHRRGGCGCE